LGTDRETISGGVSDEAVQAAAVVLGRLFGGRSSFERDERHADATMVLVAAVPHIEAAIRSRIADEIKAESVEKLRDERDGDDVCDWNVALLKAEVIIEIVCESVAARVARGGSR
jgi:hypothetical protein